MTMGMNDEDWMRMAIGFAGVAILQGQRPFGGIIIDPGGRLIGAGGGSETETDPTCHHEILCIRSACEARGRLLHDCTMYSTHEPCLMCTGAILHAKISRVVWGSSRSDLPLLFRPLDVGDARWLDTSHPPEVVSGVLRQECVDLFEGELALRVAEEVRFR